MGRDGGLKLNLSVFSSEYYTMDWSKYWIQNWAGQQ